MLKHPKIYNITAAIPHFDRYTEGSFGVSNAESGSKTTNAIRKMFSPWIVFDAVSSFIVCEFHGKNTFFKQQDKVKVKVKVKVIVKV